MLAVLPQGAYTAWWGLGFGDVLGRTTIIPMPVVVSMKGNVPNRLVGCLLLSYPDLMVSRSCSGKALSASCGLGQVLQEARVIINAKITRATSILIAHGDQFFGLRIK
jgi:hypothetical protein